MRITEDIELVAEAGDASDAIELSLRLAREGDVGLAVKVRRAVTRGQLDRDVLRALLVEIAEATVQAHREWDRFLSEVPGVLRTMEANGWLKNTREFPRRG